MTQKTITNFFKSKVHLTPSFSKDMEVTKKKRTLSLAKTPTPAKSPKKRLEDQHVIDLSVWSDDEDFCTPPPSRTGQNLSQNSIDSDKTVIYSVSPKTAQTPKKTPQATASPVAVSPSKTSTPGSLGRFFSPNKKRSVKNRTPLKSRKNLNEQFSRNFEETVTSFDKAAEANDDKTIFFLQMINKYLEDTALRPLLDRKSQELLESSHAVVKPGMKLICRLFWRKDGWFKRQDINKIVTKGQTLLDDPSLDLMTHSLVASNWLKQDSNNMSFEELSLMLKAEEIKQICKDLKLKVQSKQGAVESLRSFSRRTSNINSYFTPGKVVDNSMRVLRLMRERAGPCYKMSELARITLGKLYVLMYLGMDYSIIRDKKLELALIHDKINRETYPVDKAMVLDNATVVFDNNEEFERYMTAHNIYEEFLNETDSTVKASLVKQVFMMYKSIKSDEMSRYKALPVWLRRFTPAQLYIRILDAGIQDLKKEKSPQSYELALEILTRLIGQTAFRLHKKPGWYAEKALILHSLLHRCDEAAEVLLEGLKSELSEEEKDLMRRRAVKIARQKTNKISDHLKTELLDYANKDAILEKNLSADHVEKQPMENLSKGKTKFETKTAEGRIVLNVEDFCIYHYLSTGQFTHGEHWEGKIATTLFFVLFWDIIYSKPRGVRGIFLSCYQVYPLDLFTEGFYVNRRTLIDDRLRVIEECSEEELLQMMADVWNTRPDYEMSGINRSITWEQVRSVACCAGAPAVAALCARLAKDYRYTHSGFPDVTLWNEHSREMSGINRNITWEQVRSVACCAGAPAVAALCARFAKDYRYTHSGFPDVTLWNEHSREIKFVEVKTDADHPSMKQIQWMNYLREHDIDTGFCYVGVHTTKQRCRAGKTT